MAGTKRARAHSVPYASGLALADEDLDLGRENLPLRSQTALLPRHLAHDDVDVIPQPVDGFEQEGRLVGRAVQHLRDVALMPRDVVGFVHVVAEATTIHRLLDIKYTIDDSAHFFLLIVKRKAGCSPAYRFEQKIAKVSLGDCFFE